MKYKAHSELPDDYQLVWKGDFKENKKLFYFLNFGSLILLVPFLIIYFVFIFDLNGYPNELWIMLILYIPIIIIHELIHGIFFKMARNVKIKFKFHGFAASCSAPDFYFGKKHYFIAGLAPAIIISLGLLIPLLFVEGLTFAVLYLLFCFHFGGCIGDFYICGKLLKQPKDVLIRDYGIGMEFYSHNN